MKKFRKKIKAQTLEKQLGLMLGVNTGLCIQVRERVQLQVRL